MNMQKGFVKAFIFIIILIIIAGGFYFIFYNKKIVTLQINPVGLSDSSKYNSYTSYTGVFSIKYPTTWLPSSFNPYYEFLALISKPFDERKISISFFITLDKDGILLNELKKDESFTQVGGSFNKIDGYLTDTYQGQNGKFYVINLGQYDKTPASIITGLIISSGNPTEQEYAKLLKDVENVVKSITIDKNKIQEMVKRANTAQNEAHVKGSDAVIKANLNNARAMAELYYDKTKSYSGFCKSEDYSKIADAIKKVSPATIVCRDSKESYVFSSPLVTGGFFCVDSTGMATNSKAMNTENACERINNLDTKTPPPPPLLPL